MKRFKGIDSFLCASLVLTMASFGVTGCSGDDNVKEDAIRILNYSKVDKLKFTVTFKDENGERINTGAASFYFEASNEGSPLSASEGDFSLLNPYMFSGGTLTVKADARGAFGVDPKKKIVVNPCSADVEYITGKGEIIMCTGIAAVEGSCKAEFQQVSIDGQLPLGWVTGSAEFQIPKNKQGCSSGDGSMMENANEGAEDTPQSGSGDSGPPHAFNRAQKILRDTSDNPLDNHKYVAGSAGV